jgi:hypothetical protein
MGKAYLVGGVLVETAINAAFFYLDFALAMKTAAAVLALGLVDYRAASGKQMKDKCLYCGPDPVGLVTHLNSHRICMDKVEKAGDLIVTDGLKETYKDGRFDPETAADSTLEFIRAAAEHGHPARIIADITSLTADESHIRDFLLKARELLATEQQIIGVCMYDLTKISPSLVLSLMSYHSAIITGSAELRVKLQI